MPPDYNLLEYHRGTITAPAGCGKTQIIADTLALHTGARPVLILTHTNAGVATLRLRMQRAGVSAATYRIATIDGFAMRLVAMFPARSGLNVEVLQLRNRGADYPAIRLAACQLLQGGHLNEVLAASYTHLIVDEYQDCNLVQHAMVTALSIVLPACVLGDPMQAIFGFRGNQLVNWDQHVLANFPLIGELNHPWRWANSGAPELGRWLLDCRRMLLNGNAIDLRQVPAEVVWVPLQAETAAQQRLTAAQTRAVTATGQVLVIGNSYDTRGRQQMASQTPGATTVEAVDLVDLTDFGAGFNLEAADALTRLVQFAAGVMTQVGPAALLPRLETLRRGRARNPPTAAEAALVAFAERPGFTLAAEALRLLSRQDNARVYRPEVLRCCLRALQSAAAGSCTFADATVNERERNRHESRPLARRVIGSTLLLKGLEGEVAVITSPEEMDARHLYVAMTRGSSRLVVCSLTPILTAR